MDMNTQTDYEYVSYNIDTRTYNKSRINDKAVQTNLAKYTMLKYDSHFVCNADKTTQLYRSIVLSSDNELLSFSPPKSTKLDDFTQKYPEVRSNMWINEIIEGTMVNLFYDERIQSWEISTKGSVGGNYWFYRTEYDIPNNSDKSKSKQPTFRDMFFDVFRITTSNCTQRSLNEITFLEYLPKHYSYSFVLQHPSNHIVLQINEPKLYLVALYEIYENHVVCIPPCIYEGWDCFFNIRGIIDFPTRYIDNNDNNGYKSWSQLISSHCSIQSRYDKVGIMITNMETGERVSVKNPVYEDVKKMRGNHPNLQYQYLCLLRIGKINDFLTYFPMYKQSYHNFYNQYNDFITNIHKSYVSQYIHKNKMIPVSKKYQVHIWRLHHQIYLPSLHPPSLHRNDNVSNGNNQSKRIVTRHVVKKYIDEMDPGSILYYLFYEDRQYAQIIT